MKLAKILFVLAFVVVLAGCGAKQDDTATTDNMVMTGSTGTDMVDANTDTVVDSGAENTGTATVVVVDNTGAVATGEVATGEVATGTVATGN